MQHDPDLKTPDAADELTRLTAAATGLGRETVDVAGFLSDLDERCQGQLSDLSAIGARTADLATSSARMLAAVRRMAELSDVALEKTQEASTFIHETGQSSQTLAEWVRSVDADGQVVEDMLGAVKTSNSVISDIAWQVHILAINAKIEAARAGQAGKRFSIVAEAVQDLSQKTASAAETINGTVARLSDWMSNLQTTARDTADKAEQVLKRNAENDRALGDIQNGIEQIRQESRSLSEDARTTSSAVSMTERAADDIAASIASVAEGVDEANKRCLTLIDTSEAILQHAAALGGNGEDSAMITLVQDIAGRISAAMERALADERITLDDLFSEHYRPVPGSDPEQVITPFTALTEELLPPIQEPVLKHDDRIVFCAAVDRNGYLPAHNQKFSKPQGDDPVWNAANCRNRRIFADRVGLKAGRNEHPFLLQVYRRDMGGGTFVLMKDLSAPICVAGRHWGGLRLAYKI
ncbi:methyl-accepting chemotaxis protein [Sagittula stellata]|uniref:Methyl-accepting chemotaxis sensory transducer n=1 Tax=Sagittula stellata (strain ATCC 700073 / DSM 11524 / E-37) TaxID=388399 RepID=A3K1P8_SAGS3|nr:methyl-accepting chemotaxis protein [Sagittula stellata]EBA08844.1 methyl-accepting chemotaxis sensory transducer [Sagittula stellata E-37]